jgi:hypothetical protein
MPLSHYPPSLFLGLLNFSASSTCQPTCNCDCHFYLFAGPLFGQEFVLSACVGGISEEGDEKFIPFMLMPSLWMTPGIHLLAFKGAKFFMKIHPTLISTQKLLLYHKPQSKNQLLVSLYFWNFQKNRRRLRHLHLEIKNDIRLACNRISDFWSALRLLIRQHKSGPMEEPHLHFLRARSFCARPQQRHAIRIYGAENVSNITLSQNKRLRKKKEPIGV